MPCGVQPLRGGTPPSSRPEHLSYKGNFCPKNKENAEKMKKNDQKFAYVKKNTYLYTRFHKTASNMNKQTIIRAVVAGLLAALGVIATAVGLTSCNVTRTITTQSSVYQKGDTSVTIQTKTIEVYDASKKGAFSK